MKTLQQRVVERWNAIAEEAGLIASQQANAANCGTILITTEDFEPVDEIHYHFQEGHNPCHYGTKGWNGVTNKPNMFWADKETAAMLARLRVRLSDPKERA